MCVVRVLCLTASDTLQRQGPGVPDNPADVLGGPPTAHFGEEPNGLGCRLESGWAAKTALRVRIASSPFTLSGTVWDRFQC